MWPEPTERDAALSEFGVRRNNSGRLLLLRLFRHIVRNHGTYPPVTEIDPGGLEARSPTSSDLP